MAILPFSKPCVDKKFFINRKFKEVAPNTYERVERHPPIMNMMNGLRYDAERTLQFKVFHVDPEYGTYVEIRIDKRLDCNMFGYGSGYWHDEKDFLSTFKQL